MFVRGLDDIFTIKLCNDNCINMILKLCRNLICTSVYIYIYIQDLCIYRESFESEDSFKHVLLRSIESNESAAIPYFTGINIFFDEYGKGCDTKLYESCNKRLVSMIENNRKWNDNTNNTILTFFSKEHKCKYCVEFTDEVSLIHFPQTLKHVSIIFSEKIVRCVFFKFPSSDCFDCF